MIPDLKANSANLSQSKWQRLGFVDGLRGLAALYVVLSHAWDQSWFSTLNRHGSNAKDWLLNLTGWLNHGDFAVVIFIVISGFCLTLPTIQSRSQPGQTWVGHFYKRRARRILPPYYAALCLSIFLDRFVIKADVHSFYSRSLPISSLGIVLHFLLLQNLSKTTWAQINGPLWSIAVECQIYLLFPLLLWLRRRFGLGGLVGLTYILCITAQNVLGKFVFMGPGPIYIFYFALGMFAAEAVQKPSGKIAIWVLIVGSGILLLMSFRPILLELTLSQILVAVVGMSCIIVCGQWPHSTIARTMSWRPLMRLGAFSYSLYLIHLPLQQIIWQDFARPLQLGSAATFALMLTAGTGIVLFISYAFYLLVERPFLSRTARASIAELAG